MYLVHYRCKMVRNTYLASMNPISCSRLSIYIQLCDCGSAVRWDPFHRQLGKSTSLHRSFSSLIHSSHFQWIFESAQNRQSFTLEFIFSIKTSPRFSIVSKSRTFEIQLKTTPAWQMQCAISPF